MKQQKLVPECLSCHGTEDLHVNSRYKGVVSQYICRPCGTEKARKYRATDAGKQAIRRAVDRYTQPRPEYRAAWVAARKIPNQPCEVCGATALVHRHHDDISKPLNVMFLCPMHHKARHRELKAQVAV